MPDVRRANPLIAETMQYVAHVPIRNRGTVVGSLCHADPSAEMPLLFVLLDGTLIASGPNARVKFRRQNSSNRFSRHRQQNEIVVEARLSVLPPGVGWAFDEVTRRHGDYALVGVGCVLRSTMAAERRSCGLPPAEFPIGPCALRLRKRR